MKFGAFFFGGVEMTDAGAGLPNSMDRRFDNAGCWKATLDSYGRSRGYMGSDGRPAAPGLVPTLEESMARFISDVVPLLS